MSLPPDWVEKTDKKSNKIFYYNTKTKETRWKKPELEDDISVTNTKSDNDESQETINSLPEKDNDEKKRQDISSSLTFLINFFLDLFDKSNDLNGKITNIEGKCQKLVKCFDNYELPENKQHLALILSLFISSSNISLAAEGEKIVNYLLSCLKETKSTSLLDGSMTAVLALSLRYSSLLLNLKIVNLLIPLLINTGFVNF
jgi:uncharacterized protein YdcH (DUF465 family)